MTVADLNHRRKLVVFDVEGVLLPKNRYLIFEVGRNLNLPQRFKLVFTGLLYEIGLLSLESALKRVFNLLKGFSVDEMLDIFKNVPLLPNVEAVFARLKEKGLKTAIISSGLPQVLVENLASRLKIDYAFGLELEMNNRILTGDIKGNVIKENGKSLALDEILRAENFKHIDCAVVADDRNNASIFHKEALRIGFNPDFAVALKSNHVVKGNLMEVVFILEGTQKKPRYSLSRNDAIREIIHASGVSVIPAAALFNSILVVFLLVLTTLAYSASELARITRRAIPIISSVTLNAATPSEKHEFALTPIFLALGIALSLILFPSPINYAAIAIVSLGDSAASIFGKFFGKIPIPYNKAKNLEGSIAMFAFAFFSASIFLNPLQALIGAVTGTLIESLPTPFNDNILTPLATGAMLTFLS